MAATTPWCACPAGSSPGSWCRAILRSAVAEVVEACERGDLEEARGSAGLLLADLDALLMRYEAALGEHEIPRPY